MTTARLDTVQEMCSSSVKAGRLGGLDIRDLQPGEDDAWDRFVTAAPEGTFFHLSGWKTIVEKVLRRRCHYLTARAGDAIRGVFPISLVRSRLFGNCLVSSPLAVYGGICSDGRDSHFGLLQAGCDLANRL